MDIPQQHAGPLACAPSGCAAILAGRRRRNISKASFRARTGIDIVHVPYKELVQALTALMSGDVQMTFVRAR